MVSFVPTFEPVAPKGKCDISDDVPTGAELNEGKDFIFVFLVDCSGSMSGGPIKTTVEALNIFL
jgi:hypothetical protein